MKTKEHRLINSLVFNDKMPSAQVIKNICEEKFIKICSSHLIIPLVYLKILEKKCQKFFPKEMIDYMKEIYLINKNRNEKLILEAGDLAKIIKDEKIKFVFIKGTAMILGNFYKNIGERMIGDIDFLVKGEKIDEVDRILNKNGYKSKNKFVYSISRHIRKKTKRKYIFAIEPHFKLISSKKIYMNNEKFILNSKYAINDNIPETMDIFLNNIYNHQINDYGNLKMYLNYRNLYDTFVLSKHLELKNLKTNNILNNYFILIKKNKIFELDIQTRYSFWFELIYKIKNFNKLTSAVYIFCIEIKIYSLNYLNRFIEVFKNRKYRKKLLRKLGL